jgi:RNA polymerase sigma-70 factor, ECF subfamily
MSDHIGPTRERGMFAKEAYLAPEFVRAQNDAARARGRAIDTRFAEVLADELNGAYRLAGYLLADATEAQDAVQEASVRAWRAWSKLREQDKFHSWFNQILVNVCRTRLRKKARQRTLDVDDVDLEGPDPFRSSLARDAIGRAISSLSTELRMVVVLRYWGDLPLADIAERLQIPIGTVKSRHHAALAQLRRRIEPATGGNV